MSSQRSRQRSSKQQDDGRDLNTSRDLENHFAIPISPDFTSNPNNNIHIKTSTSTTTAPTTTITGARNHLTTATPQHNTTMLRNRAVPAAAAAVGGGLLWWQTAGGRNQPVGRAERGNVPISETLQGKAGTGGARARAQGELEVDPKDTRVVSHKAEADSKRSPVKVGREEL